MSLTGARSRLTVEGGAMALALAPGNVGTTHIAAMRPASRQRLMEHPASLDVLLQPFLSAVLHAILSPEKQASTGGVGGVARGPLTSWRARARPQLRDARLPRARRTQPAALPARAACPPPRDPRRLDGRPTTVRLAAPRGGRRLHRPRSRAWGAGWSLAPQEPDPLPRR